jgi:hypothetical protein
MAHKQTHALPISAQLWQRWKARGVKTKDWPEIIWYVEDGLRRKLRKVQKKHGPTAIDVAYDRKTRKAEDKELDLLAGHLDPEQPQRVYHLHERTGWHHSKVERLLARLKAMKRARQENGGWLAIETAAKPPSANGQAAESTSADGNEVPENAKRVQVKVKGVGWVGTEVEWSNDGGMSLGHVLINCNRCAKNTDVYLSHDRTSAGCWACDATMPIRKA